MRQHRIEKLEELIHAAGNRREFCRQHNLSYGTISNMLKPERRVEGLSAVSARKIEHKANLPVGTLDSRLAETPLARQLTVTLTHAEVMSTAQLESFKTSLELYCFKQGWLATITYEGVEL